MEELIELMRKDGMLNKYRLTGWECTRQGEKMVRRAASFQKTNEEGECHYVVLTKSQLSSSALPFAPKDKQRGLEGIGKLHNE